MRSAKKFIQMISEYPSMRVGRPAVIAVLVLSFSGCADEGAGPGPKTGSRAQESQGPQADHSPMFDQSVNESTLGTPMREFVWNQEDASRNISVGIELRYFDTGRCTIFWGASGEDNGSPVRVAMMFDGYTYPVSSWKMTRTTIFQVHAGDVDTRSESQGDKWAYASVTAFDSQAGRLMVLIAAFGLKPWSNGVTDGQTVFFRIRCDSEFYLLSIWGSRELVSFTGNSLEGGAGTSITTPNSELGTSMEARGKVSRTFVSPVVLFRGFRASSASDWGKLALTHPNGQTEWEFTPFDARGHGKEFSLDGPSGLYGVTLSLVSAGQDSLRGILLGLSPMESLAELRELASCKSVSC